MRGTVQVAIVAAVIVGSGPFGPPASAERLPVQLDGVFNDWKTDPVYTDVTGDAGASMIDLGGLWVADDANNLYLRFDVGAERLLNAGNDLALYLDTDMDDRTGLAIGGIGAELEWRFGSRSGSYRGGVGVTGIRHTSIRFIGLPSVTSSEFEVGISRKARPDGSHLLFPGSEIRILLTDGAGGDRLPDEGEVVTYRFDQGSLPIEGRIPLGKQRATDLRMITNNTLRDGPWDSARAPKLRREVRALMPEIVNFQEVYGSSPQEMASLLESWLPSEEGQGWHAARNEDCHTISRYPILHSWPLGGNLVSLIDARSAIGSQLLVVNAHLYCCENDAGRQREVDQIMAFIRNAIEPGGVEIPTGTPIVIVGDMNFVGSSRQLRTLTTGDIEDNATFGPDFGPDRDGSDLRDLISRYTEKRLSATWLGDGSDYWPGRLDFCILSDASIGVGNHYILNTAAMSPDTLSAHGLLAGDDEASDHLPICVDLRAGSYADSGGAGGGGEMLRLAVAPNPSVTGVTIATELPEAAEVLLEVCDPAGRRIAWPLGSNWVPLEAGPWSYHWDGRDDAGGHLPAGSYLIRLRVRAGGHESAHTAKWVCLR
jgi:hypothetical protein